MTKPQDKPRNKVNKQALLAYITIKPQIVLLVLSKVLKDFVEAHNNAHNTYAKRYGWATFLLFIELLELLSMNFEVLV